MDMELPLLEHEVHGRVCCLRCVWGGLVAAATREDVQLALDAMATAHTAERHQGECVDDHAERTMAALSERVELAVKASER